MKENQNKERFEQLGTKIDPAMAEVLDACCNALGVDVYHLLQWFAYVIVKAAAPMHGLDPRIQKLMTLMESDVGWQKAFNQCNPDRLNIDQVIVILEQEGHKGFGAAMIDKPWMGESRQTECVDDILECVTEATMVGIYNRLRRMGARLDCENLSDVLLTMLDAQSIILTEDENRFEMKGQAMYDQRGRKIEYGKKSKAKQHRTPDSVARDQRIIFDDIDREVADYEVKDWEGEHHDRT
jgi:hypothetical protein